MTKVGDEDSLDLSMEKKGDATILYVCTYPPRECGIATFTRDLTDAMDARFSPYIKSRILAMNNNGMNIYNYPKHVRYQISDNDIDDYIEIAKRVNDDDSIKLVCVQHEFGIFGGSWGDNLLAFLELIDKPVVITFHSVLPNPDDRLKHVVQAIARRVDEIIVMTPKAVEILETTYGVEKPITIIPHGIPTVTFEAQDKEKKRLGFDNKTIISSFGMMSPGKGYENVIASLPEVVKKYPNLLYIIVGETHPNIRKIQGEEYRNMLMSVIKKHKLEKHVKFYNKYVTLEEIISYLKASDIYISSGANLNQITSGTLAYAMGCGRAVVSTPFLHAIDSLDKKKGLLVNVNEKDSFKKHIIYLLDNPKIRKDMETNSYYASRNATWPNVTHAYMKVFKKYMSISNPEIRNLPQIKTDHLLTLTDKFGIIQFADQTTPNITSGYSLDDNARALLVCAMHYEKFRQYEQLKLINTYLDYIKYVQDPEGKLYNFVNKKKIVNFKKWSQDAHGRALWALGYLYSSENIPNDFKEQVAEIFQRAIAPLEKNEIDSPRAMAFTIKGLYFFNREINSPKITNYIQRLASKLEGLYNENSSHGWNWFELCLTYANSKLPEAMIYAYLSTRDKKYLDVGLASLDFLISKTFKRTMFIPIGEKGWYQKDGERAMFDQQPIDVAYMVETLILAYQITGYERYKKNAIDSFQWFLGKNMLKQVVYNEQTGGCHDGVGETSINLNQGAESTLSYLIARLSLEKL